MEQNKIKYSVQGTTLLRCVHQPWLQWKINKYYMFRVCICSCRYPACNAYVPYFHL